MDLRDLLPRPVVAFVPTRPYQQALRWLEELGQDPGALLAEAGIDPERMWHPEGVLDLDQVEAFVLRAAERVAGRSTELGGRLLFPAHGQVGFAALTAGSVEEAVAVAERYLELLCPLFALERTRVPGCLRLELSALYRMEPRVFLVHVKVILSSLYALLRQGVGVVPEGVRLATPWMDPELLAWLEGRGVAVQPSAETVTVWVPDGFVASAFRMADARAHAGFIAQCEQLLSASPRHDGTIRAVRRLLRDSAPLFPEFDAVCRQLATSERTLRRRLSVEGAPYHQLLTEARFSWAARQLVGTDRPVAAIADELGFSTAANFTRAFTQALGVTPSAYRRHGRESATSPHLTRADVSTGRGSAARRVATSA